MSIVSIVERWVAWCCALLAMMALASCGTQSDSTAAGTAGADSAGDAGSEQDATAARLAIAHAHAEPGGPTTSSTITLAFDVGNSGTAPTPSVHAHRDHHYLPIVWRVLRDNQLVGTGVISGLMPGDAARCSLTLQSEPPGDKTYRVVVDPDATLGLPDAITPAVIQVPFGSSG